MGGAVIYSPIDTLSERSVERDMADGGVFGGGGSPGKMRVTGRRERRWVGGG